MEVYQHYRDHGGLWSDLIATLPIDLLVVVSIGVSGGTASLFQEQALRTMSLLRLTKLMRVQNLAERVGALETFVLSLKQLNLTLSFVRLFKLMGVFLLLGHVLGCIWYGLVSWNVNEASGHVSNNWVAVADLSSASLGTKYLHAFYFQLGMSGTA